ncbi:two component transcriptional regulator, winged helix family protein [Paenibacillus vortex V453]|uniref:Two component transcriptional regulator, winged helix family protein n=1 Tax=Paenibacillus vortex V453 TaxID=715225 RepID=A0A2R9T0J1_9BACL|nr:response regulator transcription factor [Paenibacillus vortex]EFU43182.1 two component transcriptional regulator, winged helix family protein [Paenibacillus vortex V453]
MNLLIADDEQHMLHILKAYFEKEGFTVFLAQDGEEAVDLFYHHKMDLVILDWMMPKRSGIEVCRTIKQLGHTKVLLLTAKGEADDEFAALQSGADDYVRKPFDPRILLLRAKKLLHLNAKVVIGNVTVDLEEQRIYRGEQDVMATHKEFELMKYFLANKGRILSRKMLLDHVWGFDYFGDERTVDTHIRRLREKIGESCIQTHRGMGYSLDDSL